MKIFYKLSFIFFLLSTPVFAQESFIKHKVGKGETIVLIAQKYNLEQNDIYKLNPDAQKGIKENDLIFIPNIKTHVVAPKETIYALANSYNVKVEDLKNANAILVTEGIKVGQRLIIPAQSNTKSVLSIGKMKDDNTTVHVVKPKETLFSIARDYNVSVQDLDALNKELLLDGLRIGETIKIPNKKKTIDGKARVINGETIFHTVEPKETKYAIAKKYGITVEQLETQNPEIINGLKEGTKLAINTTKIVPLNQKEELMLALAEKQAAVEKAKIIAAENAKLKVDKATYDIKIKEKQTQVEDLQDRIVVQKSMNEKVLKVNNLKVNLKDIDEKKDASVEKLKLVLEANKNVQELLLSKLDSLVYTMKEDVEKIKNTEISDVETAKLLERESAKNSIQTNEVLQQLKRDLLNNRKDYTLLMNKVQIVALEENNAYKKKAREASQKPTNETSLAEIKKIEVAQNENEKQNKKLLTKVDALQAEREFELKRRIKNATFYSEESRTYDDRLAQEKIKRYRREAESKQKIVTSLPDKKINLKPSNTVNIEVLKDLKDINPGLYLVLGIFKEAKERDNFVMKAIDAGELNTAFFYNFNTFSYYVYSEKFEQVSQALSAYKQKEGTKFHEKMLIVNIKETE